MDILTKDETYLFDRDRLIREFTRTYSFTPLPEYGLLHPIYLDAISLLPEDNISLQCVLQTKYLLAYQSDKYSGDVDTVGLFARAGLYVSNPQRLLDNEDIEFHPGCRAGLALNLLQSKDTLSDEEYKAVERWEMFGDPLEVLNALDAVNPVILEKYIAIQNEKFCNEPCRMYSETLHILFETLNVSELNTTQLSFLISNIASTLLHSSHLETPDVAFEIIERYIPKSAHLPYMDIIKEHARIRQSIAPVDLFSASEIYNIINMQQPLHNIDLPELS